MADLFSISTLKVRGEVRPYIVTKKGLKRLDHFNWQIENGDIPDGYYVHHLDHSLLNCEIDNLEIRAKHARWKPKELNFIRDNVDQHTDKEIAAKMGKTMAQIKGARGMHGIIRTKKQYRPAKTRNRHPIGTIVIRQVFGQSVDYIKTDRGWRVYNEKLHA